MERADRYLVDEVVFAEYPNLVATSIGEDEDRHIVVYRKGQQPKDVPFEATLIGETIIVSDMNSPLVQYILVSCQDLILYFIEKHHLRTQDKESR